MELAGSLAIEVKLLLRRVAAKPGALRLRVLHVVVILFVVVPVVMLMVNGGNPAPGFVANGLGANHTPKGRVKISL
jgi:hypothetical protein